MNLHKESLLHHQDSLELQDNFHLRKVLFHNPLLRKISTQISAFAMEHMLWQFAASHNYQATEHNEAW